MKKKIVAITPFVVLMIYLLLGFIIGGSAWGYGAFLFLLVPIMPFVVRLKKLSELSISLVIAIIYVVMCLVAMLVFDKSIWHPGWVIFLLIPIIHILGDDIKDDK